MSTDTETTKKLLELVAKQLREMEREMLAHVAVIEVLKQHIGLRDEIITQMLDAARGLPAIEKQLQEKYDQTLKSGLARIDAAELQKHLQPLLAKLETKRPPN